MIKLTFGKVVEGDEVYRPPAIITLSKEREEEIIAAGNAVPVDEHEHRKKDKHVQRPDSE